jgi:hypothetical protein
MSKLIVNVQTGEEVLKELSKADKDQQKIDEAQVIELQAEATAKATAKAAILERLGLTADELKTILG